MPVIASDDVTWETGPELINPGRTAFGPGRVHRYLLTRTWDAARPPATWVMPNPSKADAFVMDPTALGKAAAALRDAAQALADAREEQRAQAGDRE